MKLTPALLALSTAVACGSSEVETGDEDLSVLRDTIWLSDASGLTSISVCWETPGFASEKRQAQATVARTWSAVARVDFTGWQDCGPQGAAELRIRIADERPRGAVKNNAPAYGRQMRYLPGSLTLNFTHQVWGPACNNADYKLSDCMDTYTMHEFGHVLGFLHEQDRPDAFGLCPAGLAERNAASGARGFSLGRYDPNSIMNYCTPVNFIKPKLSAGDIAGVRRVYKPR
jgi:hypothetical protein